MLIGKEPVELLASR